MFRTALSSLLARIRHRRRAAAADRAARMADDLDRQPPIAILMHIRGFLSLVREIVRARESYTGRAKHEDTASGGGASDRSAPPPRKRD
jgi:hypothetical protein